MLHDKHPMKLHMKLHFGEFGMPADAVIPLFSLFFAFLTKPEVYCAGEFYTLPANFFTMPVNFILCRRIFSLCRWIFSLCRSKKRHFSFSSPKSPMSEKSKATFRIRKSEITHIRKNAKRHFKSGRPRSPMSEKSEATFHMRKHKVTHVRKKQSDISHAEA